jgi:hypothetical protein
MWLSTIYSKYISKHNRLLANVSLYTGLFVYY